MATIAQSTLSRILAAGGNESSGENEHNNRLAKEFLRRSALWARQLACTSDWPFFDIARKLDADIAPEADFEKQLRGHLNGPGKVAPLMCRLLLWSLRWAALQDRGITRDYPLPDPFLPILSLYERGGELLQHKGMLLTPIYGFRPHSCEYYANHKSYIDEIG